MLAAFTEVKPILFIGLGIAFVGSLLGIFWYRATAPSNFDKDSVLFIIKLFSAIGAGTIVLGIIMKQMGSG
jgi:hypothetical protein